MTFEDHARGRDPHRADVGPDAGPVTAKRTQGEVEHHVDLVHAQRRRASARLPSLRWYALRTGSRRRRRV